NTMVLRNDLSGNVSFSELLERVKKTCLDAYSYQDLPFEYLVDSLKIKRDASRSAIFDVMFVLQNAGDELCLNLPGINSEVVNFGYNTSKFDILLSLTETENGLTGEFEYNTDLYNGTTIKRMSGHFSRLLESIIENPEEKIEYLQIITSEEEEQIKNWNSTDAFFPEDVTLHELFLEEVRKNPSRTAVIVENKSLSYKDLNKRANCLANHLINDYSVKKDTFVGLCMERSFEMIISMVAIMKAGGAYVPIDPDYPLERMKYIMKDGELDVIVSQSHLISSLPFLKENRTNVISLDTQWDKINKASDREPIIECDPSDLAYIIYTSGSTGKPKGVMVEHRGVVNRILWMQKEYNLTSKDRILQKTPFSFDVSVWEFIWPILTGSTLCFAKPGGHKDPDYLIKTIQDYGITTIHFVPSMFKVFLDTLRSSGEKVDSIKRIICSGEALSNQLAVQCRELIPWATLQNLYGPTEASIDVTYWDCNSTEHRENAGVPIGMPIDNTQLYILDKHLNLLPTGVPGELYLGGAGLARGYVNLPSVTKERFIDNPFYKKGDKAYNSRLYKTGDLVRYLPDGAVDYIGRTDFQVKVRGFRIELGEIESVLNEYVGVNQNVVVVREDEGEKIIVAYYVLTESGSDEIPVDSLRSFLGKRLTEYMVPSIFVHMEELPLTQSGKVNRRALPPPTRKDRVTEGEFVPPKTSEECVLANIWQDILHLDKIGIYDNFFSMGGHSLSATRVASQVSQFYDISCPVKVLFECPTILSLSTYVSEQLSYGPLQSHSIELADRNEILPLSFAQQRLWFLHQYEEGQASTYNIPLAYRIKGGLNIPLLEQSFNILINRHESFRTVFKTKAGIASQEILPPFNLKITIEDISEDKLASIITEEANHTFDLTKGPILRVRLLKLKDKDHVLLINQHHIISDGWSVEILLNELEEIYSAYSSKTQPALEDLKFQYADFASWQKKWLHGEILEDQVKYWRNKLEDFISLDLPSDKIRPAIRSTEGKHYYFKLDKLGASITDLAKETGTTNFMVLLAAFNVLLKCYSGKEDIISGSPIANRNHRGLENIIGFFVNTLVLRNDLSGNPDFIEVIGRVKETCLEAYGHQDLPFDQLIDELNVEREPSHNPIFDVMFVVENKGLKLNLPDVEIADLTVGYDISKFDLTFTVKEEDDELSGNIEYSTSLYNEETIERMAEHFNTLLKSLLNNPKGSINKLSVLTQKEKELILTEWNQTETPYPHDKTIHQLFEEQAEKNPDKIAVIFEEEKLTYKELNEKANKVAHAIRGQYKWMYEEDIKPDTLIGLCMNRSINLIIGTLGILKAGCAYLPLDPTYPDKRLNFMMEDACAPIMLVSKEIIERLLFLNDVEYGVISLDSGWEAIEPKSSENPVNINKPGDLAYVIYTSGSTGKPKGVMIEHKSVNRLVRDTNFISISPEDRVSNAANISFDAATLEIWSGLLNGATVISVSQDVLLNVDLFTEFIEREKINVLFLTASLFHYYGTNKPSIYSKLKYLMSGGDTLNPDIIYKILRCPQGAPEYIINCYGPTENATITTTFHVAEALSKGRSIPIGKSIANTTSYILDNGLNPLPVGVPGALYTGGEGLSRGYLHRPVITAERFIDNPFATPSEIERGRNTVIYNTGDLARWLPDGNIEFLGRSDNQIKIRGFRIELEEIEALLGSHTSVSQCVVIVRTAGDQKQIIAYYVPEEKDPVTKKVLRAFLENELPDYMIPSVFMEMRSLPMTSHQKVDRKALPSPDESDFASGTKFVAPETENEKALAEIWKSILRLERVGKNDNFFSIGGDSIMSIQVISRARDAGLYLTPKQLFSHPTIAELALEASEIKESVISASQDLMKGHSPLTPVQLWFFEKNFSVKEHFNQAFLLRFNRKIDVSILKKTMETLLKHHDALRLRYHKDKEGNWKQSFSESLEVSIKVMDISKEDNQSDFIESKCSDLQAALKLYGPVIQAGVFKGHSDGSDRLLLAVHHLIVDMVSWRIILEDFQNVYTTLADGKEFSMPAKTSSFRDWANGLKAYEGEKEMGSQLNYWQNIEKDAKPFYVELEKELHSGKEESEISVSLEKSLTLSLLQDVPQAYHTQVNDILLSALVLAYYEWTGESELFLDLEGHGREECIKNVDISRTVGWFTSVFPVRLSLPLHSGEVIDDMLISSTIKAIKEQLATIPDKGVGYGVLRYLRPETSDLCGTRGIGFNYLGKLDSADTELFGFADELSGPSTAPENKSLHLIDANGYIADDVFKMSFTYSNKNYKTETIEKFGTAFKNKLKKIINHCLKSETGGYTPSDFPLANVTQSFLDKLDQKKIETIYMASPLQKGLLFHALYEPGSDQYCTQLYWTYDGDLDRNILKKSWNTLIDRYGIFRTAFGWEGIKEAVQVVYKDVEVSWHEEDWRKFSNKERKQKLKEYVTEDRKRGFNFSEPCIMRFHILRFEKNKFEFIWTHHHTLLDGWCLSIIINELRQIYESLVKKEKIVLSKRPLYKNYIAWLMEQNKVETFDFWKKYLVDFDAPTDLSVNHKKLNIHKPIENLKRSYLYFSPSLTRTSQEFVKKHQTTFNALVKQSWATVLAHYSGNENIVVGSTVSGRPAELPGVESMIGLFINTLPFRIGTGKEKSAIERVKELHRIIQDANHYSTVTMKEIQGLTQVPAGLPMFYSLYVFENYPLDEGSMDIEGISMKDVQSFEKTNFPLTLVAAPGEKLELMVLYDSDCFEKNVIERLL
ncbi:amino acid adenylation domain-containing protein, partial [bacterium]|nr:amino acid adenylation domain-containing protein [bacterium]